MVAVNIILLCAVAYLASTDGKFGKNGGQNGGFGDFGESAELDTVTPPLAQMDSLSAEKTIDKTIDN